MARRTFFERLEDRLLKLASNTLKAATDALDVVTGPVESGPAQPPPPTTPTPQPRGRGGSRLTRVGRLEDLVRDLIEADRIKSEQIAELQAENEQLRELQARDQRQADLETAAELRQRRAEERAERKLRTYPRRVEGRLGRIHWTEVNRRMTRPDVELLRLKFNELLRVGVPETLMAVVQVKENLYDLYVKPDS
jgi:hypothetical protein